MPGMKQRYHQETPLAEAGAVVVTLPSHDGTWETNVEGGRLDGFRVTTRRLERAAAAHAQMVRLVRQACGSEAL